MWFIVKILWTWNLFFTLLEISKPFFFFSIFGNAIITIAKKKIIPLFRNDIAVIVFFFILRALHTRAHSDAQDWENWAVEFRQCHCRNSKIFSLLFLHSLLLFGWISAMPLPKFSLSPHIPNYLWTVRITQINFEFYNINPKDSENMIKSYRQNEYLFTLTVYMLAILHKVIKEEQV